MGYSFETLVLYAQPLGMGTVWVGGTMGRPAFERAIIIKRQPPGLVWVRRPSYNWGPEELRRLTDGIRAGRTGIECFGRDVDEAAGSDSIMPLLRRRNDHYPDHTKFFYRFSQKRTSKNKKCPVSVVCKS